MIGSNSHSGGSIGESMDRKLDDAARGIKSAGRDLGKDLSSAAGHASDMGREVTGAAQKLGSDMADAVTKAGEQVACYAKRTGGEIVDDALAYIKNNPARCSFGLLAAGFLLGYTARR